MDEVTQQNAALVEEAAAAAASLEEQAGRLRSVVAVFQVDEGGANAHREPVVAAPKRAASTGAMATRTRKPMPSGTRAASSPARAPSAAGAMTAGVPAVQAPATPARAPAKAATTASSAGGDQDWETF
jgi:methyl-accepting chemotaxis protein-1 (serine sensor receptor)